MFATIRRYKPKSGTFDSKAIDGLKRRVESGFVPTVQDIPGFHGYYLVSVGSKELISIGLFDDKSGAAESTKRAAEFVKNDPIKDQLGTPEVTEGECLLTKESAIATR